MKYLKVLLFICLYLQADENILFKETTNHSCNIEFESLVLDGLRAHPSIEMSRQSIKGAQFELDSARWGYFPSPSLEYSGKSAKDKRLVARIDQPIWTGGKLDSAYNKAKAFEKEAKHELNENRYKLVNNYSDAIKDYLKSKNKITVLNQNKKQFYELSLMLDRFMKAGVLSLIDKNLLNSRIASISSDLVISKSKHKVSNIQLEILSGKKINCNVNFNYKNILPLQVNVERLVEELRNFHPTLKMMDARISSARAEVQNAKSKLWPSLVLRGEHVSGTIYDESEPKSETLVYLSFTMSTGAGLSGLSNIDKAKIAVSRTKFEKSTKLKELLDKLMTEYTNYITALSHMQMVKNDINLAQLIFESNQRLFLSQKKTWLELVNSLSELSKQKIKYTELRVEKRILEYKIALTTGKVNLETLEVASGI